MRVSLLLWKQGRNIQGQGKRFLASIAMVVPIVVTGMATWWSFVLVYDATPDNSMLPAIPFIAVLVIDAYLYFPQHDSKLKQAFCLSFKSTERLQV